MTKSRKKPTFNGNTKKVTKKKIKKDFAGRCGRRSLGKQASLKTLKRYCSEIWAQIVKLRDNYSCILCGKNINLNAHHLISRKYTPAIYNVKNGITLCVFHHKWGYISGHNCSLPIYEWIKSNREDQYNWLLNEISNLKEKPWPDINYNEELQYLLKACSEFNIEVKTRYNVPDQSVLKNVIKDYSENGLTLADIVNKYKSSYNYIRSTLIKNNVKMRSSHDDIYKKGHFSPFRRTIFQYDLEHKLIREYDNPEEAANFTSISLAEIKNSLRDNDISTGYYWEYNSLE